MSDLQHRIDDWQRIGRSNAWISRAVDPPFTRESFHECATLDELKERLQHGNWCLGQAFTYGRLCFINQVDGGDEWLCIKDDLAFESITFGLVIERGEFDKLLTRLLRATPEQCRTLTYMEAV